MGAWQGVGCQRRRRVTARVERKSDGGKKATKGRKEGTQRDRERRNCMKVEIQ